MWTPHEAIAAHGSDIAHRWSVYRTKVFMRLLKELQLIDRRTYLSAWATHLMWEKHPNDP